MEPTANAPLAPAGAAGLAAPAAPTAASPEDRRPPAAPGARSALPSREEQLAAAMRYLERDGLVIVKDRPGHVADDVVRWAESRGIAVTRRQRTLGRATHWEIRRT